MKKIEDCLEIFIPTYNRWQKLARTLTYLDMSRLRNCRIYVVDNASDDDTAVTCVPHSLPNISYFCTTSNIGGAANYVQCLALSPVLPYKWILGDDDILHLDKRFDDIERAIIDSSAPLISVGVNFIDSPLGLTTTEEAIYSQKFFYKHSFAPSLIFRQDLIHKCNTAWHLFGQLPTLSLPILAAQKNLPIYYSESVVIEKGKEVHYQPLDILKDWKKITPLVPYRYQRRYEREMLTIRNYVMAYMFKLRNGGLK